MASRIASRIESVGGILVLGALVVAGWGCAGAAPDTEPPIHEEPAEPGEAPAAAPAAPAAPSSVVEGLVQGHALEVASAIFMWRERANDMQIVLSDAPDLCSTLQSRAWPGGGTVLYATIKHTGSANQDDAFGAGVYPLRGGEPIQPQDTKMARFMVFGPACDLEVQERAVAGEIRLTTEQVAIGGEVEGELTLTFDSEITGRFRASFCEPAEYEPNGCR